ncbi:hypothetical protein [Clostridium estertheticum]|uniref:hypothetical protein n=1 Tax=Clostridium estertheticum TaxID=238834 RepID=UPI001C6E0B46|nr:hypothetical protein [Clostridium estertheticum]MBW9154613.1 hypothetical protein [Clostridium estertheticum]WLC86607.1 hypothetical protein KTC97_21765 [Clostridium estertheticum]
MLYADLERKWKLSISGSINNFLNDISEDNTFIALYKYWFSDKFENVEGQLQYVKRITDERFDVDEELLDDIKKVFEERVYKKIEKEKSKTIERIKKQKVQPATDKQMKYARKLYIKVYEEEKGFDDKDYSKYEMILIIEDLVKRVGKMQKENCEECVVVELSDFRK